MTNSKGSPVVIGDEGANGTGSAVVVVPDSGCHGKQALEHSGHNATWGVPAVGFEIELALEGVVDRLDDLAQGLEEPGPGPWCLAGLGRAEQGGTALGAEGLELGGRIPLVGQDHLARTDEAGLHLEEVPGHLAFVGLGVGQGKGDRQPGRGAHQMEPKPPEVAGVAGAVAVAGEADQVGPLGCLPRPPALDRGRVDDPGVVAEQVGVGQYPGQGSELALGLAQSLVVARLARNIGEEGAQVLSGVAQEASFGGETEQRLDDGHGDQLGIAQLGGDANLGSPETKGRGIPQRVVDLHVQCGDEGVHIGFHAASRSAWVFGNAACGRLRRVSRGPRMAWDPLESLI